jgi:predicted aspartyl protease
MLIPGSFDTDGSPIVKIKVAGDLGEKEYAAVIDTGCTGFVALPLAEMIPLGLTISGAVSVQLEHVPAELNRRDSQERVGGRV